MIRLRCVNKPASGPCRIGISLTRAPASRDRAGQLFVLGRVNRRQSVGEDADGSPSRLDRTAVGGRVDAAGQSRNDRETRPGQRGRQPFGDPHAVGRAVPRADHRDGELVARLESPLSRRGGWAGRVCSRAAADNRDRRREITLTPMPPAQGQLGGGVEVLAGPGDLFGDLGADAADAQQFPARCLQDPPGRPEPLEQGLAGVRADARHHRQLDQVEQSLIVV